ncbi:MAG: IS200/IS605 family transposase [Oligoflexia bacterium]|nr:IS200/IS605 family transposase [Oligoflexia bacterium]
MSYESLSHSRFDCKYHVVFVPHCRKKLLFGKIREFLGKKFRELATQKGCRVIEGKTCLDHVHMMIEIPPKYAVSEVIGYIKGKSAIAVARQFSGRKQNFNGEKLWARGYAVSTVGFNVEQIRAYVKNQETLDDQFGSGSF